MSAPARWSWTSSNGSATAAQTQAAYNAITGHGTAGSFSYLVWNDLVDKLKATLDYHGIAWSAGGLTYQQTRMTTGDKVMTAARYNAFVRCLDSISITPIAYAAANEPCMGSYFTALATALNERI